jgi:hypothetical protein
LKQFPGVDGAFWRFFVLQEREDIVILCGCPEALFYFLDFLVGVIGFS